MKGYQINNKLYVFPQEAGELPTIDSEVAVIYVQHEDLAAFKAANEAYASKMVGYNYNTMTVKAKEWTGHTDDDIASAEPEVQTYSLTLNIDGWESNPIMQVYDNDVDSEADLTAVPAGHHIQINLNEGFSFIEGEDVMFVGARLMDGDGNAIGDQDEIFTKTEHYVIFTMPDQNAIFQAI